MNIDQFCYCSTYGVLQDTKTVLCAIYFVNKWMPLLYNTYIKYLMRLVYVLYIPAQFIYFCHHAFYYLEIIYILYSNIRDYITERKKITTTGVFKVPGTGLLKNQGYGSRIRSNTYEFPGSGYKKKSRSRIRVLCPTQILVILLPKRWKQVILFFYFLYFCI